MSGQTQLEQLDVTLAESVEAAMLNLGSSIKDLSAQFVSAKVWIYTFDRKDGSKYFDWTVFIEQDGVPDRHMLSGPNFASIMGQAKVLAGISAETLEQLLSL